MWISYDYLHDCNVKFEYGLKPKIIVRMWEGRRWGKESWLVQVKSLPSTASHQDIRFFCNPFF